MRIDVKGAIIELVLGDITAQETDAIVNAANSGLRGGGGVDGAIHRAGGPGILEETRRDYPGGCPSGSACITSGGRLKARFVIHAVGPVWRGGGANEAELLASAYRRSLELAREKQLESIAFPSLSTGAYRYPLGHAAPIALSAVMEHLRDKTSVRKVVFVLFDETAYDAYRQALVELAGR